MKKEGGGNVRNFIGRRNCLFRIIDTFCQQILPTNFAKKTALLRYASSKLLAERNKNICTLWTRLCDRADKASKLPV